MGRNCENGPICFKKLLDQIESNCSKKCYPFHSSVFQNPSISKCEEEEIRVCAENVFVEKIFYDGLRSVCKKPCEILHYNECWKNQYENYTDPNNNPNKESNLWFWIWFQFEDNQDVIVSEEYLIYDTINMIGSLGGTLGIFIGFSFSNVLNVMISWIKSCLIANISNYKN